MYVSFTAPLPNFSKLKNKKEKSITINTLFENTSTNMPFELKWTNCMLIITRNGPGYKINEHTDVHLNPLSFAKFTDPPNTL